MKGLTAEQMTETTGGLPNGWCALGWTLTGFLVGGVWGAAALGMLATAPGGICG